MRDNEILPMVVINVAVFALLAQGAPGVPGSRGLPGAKGDGFPGPPVSAIPSVNSLTGGDRKQSLILDIQKKPFKHNRKWKSA